MGKTASKKFLFLGMVVLLVASMLINLPADTPVQASSHREAPSIIYDPAGDNTDVYVFRSTEAGREGFVTLIANFIPFQEPAGGPHFYRFDPDAIYNIHIDNTGDGIQDMTFEFTFRTRFVNPDTVLGQAAPNQALAGTGGIDPLITSLTDPDYNEPQTYSVRLVGNISARTGPVGSDPFIVPPDNIGVRTTPDYEAALAQPAVFPLSFGPNFPQGRVFAGQRDEGFYIDVESIFDTLNLHSIGETGGIDTTAGFNVHSIALEVPIEILTRNFSVPTNPLDPNAVIGVWSTVRRLAPTGAGRRARAIQVSRLGHPLVNEVVVPLGLKDFFNTSSPVGDAALAPAVLDPQLPKLIQAVLAAGGISINIPSAPRNDLVAIFATGIPPGLVPGFQNFLSNGVPHEYQRLNVAIPPSASPNRLGLLGGDPAGYPNGRRVGDDVVDIELRAVLGGTPFNPNNPAPGVANPFNVAPNNTFGDGVNRNDVPYLTRFPYLGTPHPGNRGGLGNPTDPHEHHVQN